MRRWIFIVCLFVAVQAAFAAECFAADKTVRATLPTFRVDINGTEINSKTAAYPLLYYKNITYMPMTYENCKLLGLTSQWDKETGLSVSLADPNEIPTVNENPIQYHNPSAVTAAVVSDPITLNGHIIDNAKEPYPFLRYNDVTYFPLTFHFTKEEFNIYQHYLPKDGLGIYSENRFFYRYYPEGSKVLNTDFRISTILEEMTAIHISDGTGKYLSNNVKQCHFEFPNEWLYPNYKDTAYYGYLPDGTGGLKVNLDSKLHIGDLETTKITDLQNPVALPVRLMFAEFYNN